MKKMNFRIAACLTLLAAAVTSGCFGFGGFTLGGLASFLTLNKGFGMPINQVSQQFTAIIMALARMPS